MSDTQDLVAQAVADMGSTPADDTTAMTDAPDEGLPADDVSADLDPDTGDVIPDADAADEPVTPSDDEPSEPQTTDSGEETPAEPAPEKPAEAEKPADDKAHKSLKDYEAELVAQNPKLAKGRVPTLRHQAILAKTRDEHAREIEPLKARAAEFEAEPTQNSLKLARLAEADPGRFVGVLLHDQRYQQVISTIAENIIKERGLVKAQDAPAAPAVEDPGPEPKKDVINNDGTLGFSPEQLAAHFEWRLKKQRAEDAARYQALEQRLGGFEQITEQQKREQAGQQMVASARTRMAGLLEDARKNWPEFTKHEADIKAVLTADPEKRMTLEAAYRQVVLPRLVQGQDALRAQIRKEVLAEIKKAPRAASRPAPGPDLKPVDPATLSTEQLVRRSIRKIG